MKLGERTVPFTLHLVSQKYQRMARDPETKEFHYAPVNQYRVSIIKTGAKNEYIYLETLEMAAMQMVIVMDSLNLDREEISIQINWLRDNFSESIFAEKSFNEIEDLSNAYLRRFD